MCNKCRKFTDFREKIGTENTPKPCECGGTMNRSPRKRLVVLYKAKDFTRVSSDSAYRRKLSPWFGGPIENAPDNEAVQDYNEAQRKADRISEKYGEEEASGYRADANRNLEMAVSSCVQPV